MSRFLTDADVAAITVLPSPERLAALMTLTGSTRVAVKLHQQTLNVGASLMNVIASVELALRNTVCENLTAHFGSPGWLTHPPAPFQWREAESDNARKALESARRSAYSNLTQAEKSALDARAFPGGLAADTSHVSPDI
jgi:hypothetical protein